KGGNQWRESHEHSVSFGSWIARRPKFRRRSAGTAAIRCVALLLVETDDRRKITSSPVEETGSGNPVPCYQRVGRWSGRSGFVGPRTTDGNCRRLRTGS